MLAKLFLTAGASFLSVYALMHMQSFGVPGRATASDEQNVTNQKMLLIGNSRTYYHDMPSMLTKIAESSNEKVRFAITVRAWGGAALEDHWRDQQTQLLMSKTWNGVIIQPESRAQSREAYEESFFRGAAHLSDAANRAHNTVSFVVNYAYDKKLFLDNPESSRREHYDKIARDFSVLKKRYGANLIPVAEAWENLLSRRPQFALYEDGNHPTLHGSFFQALIIFAHLTHSDAATVRYYPSGVKSDEFELMKSVVKDMFDRKSI